MRPGHQTLDELYREAKADLMKGGADLALKWAFKHARAVARAEEAERAQKSFDADRYRLQFDLNDKTSPAYDIVTASLHAAAIDTAEARAVETACAHVMRMAERQAGRVSQPVPSARPKAA